MKTQHYILILLTFLFIAGGYALQPFWRGDTLSVRQVKSKWGDQAYTPEKFKTASTAEKAKMAASILADKTLIGWPIEKVREKFGSPDGFYFIDSYPAYIVQEGKDQSEETWQIVFLLNSKFEVREVIMHKNCCDPKK